MTNALENTIGTLRQKRVGGCLITRAEPGLSEQARGLRPALRNEEKPAMQSTGEREEEGHSNPEMTDRLTGDTPVGTAGDRHLTRASLALHWARSGPGWLHGLR